LYITLCMDIHCHFSWEIPRSGMTKGIFNFLGNCTTFFHNDYTILHFTSTAMTVPVVPHRYSKSSHCYYFHLSSLYGRNSESCLGVSDVQRIIVIFSSMIDFLLPPGT
jgi:hypothetical protein